MITAHTPVRRFIFLVSCCLGLGGVAFAETGVLHVRADSWMPFNGEPGAAQPGYVVEFLREVFEPKGIKVDYQVMPWADAVKAAEAGSIDGIIGANAAEAKNLVTGNEAIAEPQFALFVRKDNPWKYETLRSLQGVRLGAIDGYSYWTSLDAFIKKSTPPTLKVYTGDTPLTGAMADLAGGEIEVLPESVLVFAWTAKSTGRKFSDFRIAYSEPAEPLYVAFSKTEEGKKFARIFDKGLRDLKENGRFQKILDSYGFAKK